MNMGILNWEVHLKPKNKSTQTRFPGVLEYLWTQWNGSNITMKARTIDTIPSIITNLCRTLLFAHELYSANPTIPKIRIIAARMILSIKHTKKNILGKCWVHLVTIIAIRFKVMIRRATIWPTLWNVYSQEVEFIYESFDAINTCSPIWKYRRYMLKERLFG